MGFGITISKNAKGETAATPSPTKRKRSRPGPASKTGKRRNTTGGSEGGRKCLLCFRPATESDWLHEEEVKYLNHLHKLLMPIKEEEMVMDAFSFCCDCRSRVEDLWTVEQILRKAGLKKAAMIADVEQLILRGDDEQGGGSFLASDDSPALRMRRCILDGCRKKLQVIKDASLTIMKGSSSHSSDDSDDDSTDEEADLPKVGSEMSRSVVNNLENGGDDNHDGGVRIPEGSNGETSKKLQQQQPQPMDVEESQSRDADDVLVPNEEMETQTHGKKPRSANQEEEDDDDGGVSKRRKVVEENEEEDCIIVSFLSDGNVEQNDGNNVSLGNKETRRSTPSPCSSSQTIILDRRGNHSLANDVDATLAAGSEDECEVEAEQEPEEVAQSSVRMSSNAGDVKESMEKGKDGSVKETGSEDDSDELIIAEDEIVELVPAPQQSASATEEPCTSSRSGGKKKATARKSTGGYVPSRNHLAASTIGIMERTSSLNGSSETGGTAGGKSSTSLTHIRNHSEIGIKPDTTSEVGSSLGNVFPFLLPQAPKFMLSNDKLGDMTRIKAIKIISKLGGSISAGEQFDPDSNVLIAQRLGGSEKVVCSIAAGTFILKMSYLEACEKAGAFLPIKKKFVWQESDAKPGDKNEQKLARTSYNWMIAQRQHGKRGKMFGQKFFMLPTTEQRYGVSARMICAAGGELVTSKEEATCIIKDGQPPKKNKGIPIKNSSVLYAMIVSDPPK